MITFTLFILPLALAQICTDPNCSSCDSSGKSLTCKSGFLLSANVCIVCPLPCNGCPKGTCNTCPSNCEICENNSCSKCNAGYYSNKGYCTECVFPCKTCSTAFLCMSCVEGYKYTISEIYPACLPINNCPINCSICKDAKTCTMCSPGFYLDNKYGSCLTCSSPYCAECNIANQCNTCIKGFYLSKGACLPCQFKCEKCSCEDTCLECKSDYWLISGSCCQIGCLSCNKNACLECDLAHRLVNGYCVPPGPPSCNITYCQSCLSQTSCKTCEDGYYPDKGICVKCHKDCLSCNYKQSCIRCASGYSLVSGYCCAPGCISCGPDECWKCDSYHYLSNGTCLDKASCHLPNCLLCADGKTCKICADGYYRSGSDCVACVKNCKNCQAQHICTECNSGFSLISGYCCKAGCSCCGLEKCWKCNSTYTLTDGDCVQGK